MSTGFPNAYDMLAVNGVLPYDVNQIIFDKPSPYLREGGVGLIPSTPNKDEFKANYKEKKQIEPKRIGLMALGTYLAGALLSKSTNPLKGMKALGKFAFNLIKLPIKVFKK